MKKLHIAAVLLLIVAGVLAMSGLACAETYTFKGSCEYNGEEITSDFTSKEFAASQKEMEPGDELTYTVKYKNDTKEPTLWYMKNSVLETLEDASDVAENGGYTYQLINVGPDGKETVIFDNEEVGGETKPANLEGLKQATNATGEYFYIQDLKAGQTGTTKLHIAMDGETEVNDYMDTRGAVQLNYAVENDSSGTTGENTRVRTVVQRTSSSGNPRTGDPMEMLKYILMMAAALIIGLLAIFSWRRDKKKAAAAAAGGAGAVDVAAVAGAVSGADVVGAANAVNAAGAASAAVEAPGDSLDAQMKAALDTMERRAGKTDAERKDGES